MIAVYFTPVEKRFIKSGPGTAIRRKHILRNKYDQPLTIYTVLTASMVPEGATFNADTALGIMRRLFR
jgi:hypothetical protein